MRAGVTGRRTLGVNESSLGTLMLRRFMLRWFMLEAAMLRTLMRGLPLMMPREEQGNEEAKDQWKEDAGQDQGGQNHVFHVQRIPSHCY